MIPKRESKVMLEPSAAPLAHRKTSKVAAWSLVCGLLSFCLNVIAAGPAVILGIVGIVKVKRSGGLLGGMGLAIAGIALGIVGIFVSAIGAAVVLPAYVGVQDRVELNRELVELRQIGMACRAFAIDSDGDFPTSLDDLVPDYVSDPSLLDFAVPGETPKQWRYRPGFSTDEARIEPVAISPYPVRGRYLVLYSDTSVQTLREADVAEEILPLFSPAATPE